MLLFDFDYVYTGGSIVIGWAYRNIPNDNTIDININKGNGWENIANEVSILDGQFVWDIGSNHAENAILRIALHNDVSTYDEHVINILIPDFDLDGILNVVEEASNCLDQADADTDDDGIQDGVEDANKNGIVDIDETDPCDPDTDNDGIQDGTESGLTVDDVGPDTDLLVFIPDADPTTFTNPLIADTDGDGISDGDEDLNQNGRVDPGESDSNDADDPSLYWELTYGDTDDERGLAVVQDDGGGYVVASIVNNAQIWLFKVNSNGSQLWNFTYIGTDYGAPRSLQKTLDGGYILTGDISAGASASYGIYLLKVDSNGIEQWRKTFAGQMYGATSQQTTDEGYIIAGTIYTTNHYDYKLIKTDSSGNQQWSHTFGTSENDIARCVRNTTDGGYVVAGYTQTANNGTDFYIVKTDSNGTLTWDRTLGGSDSDIPKSIEQTTDGGYIVVGDTLSFGAGGHDIYMIKTDNEGNQIWDTTFGGSQYDFGYSVKPTADGGYIISGSTQSFGSGGSDAYLIKTDGGGNRIWSKTFGGTGNDSSNMVQQTTYGGYIAVGTSDSFGDGSTDIYLISFDPTLDTDGDGLIDVIEEGSCTNSIDADTDNDGIQDGVEDVNQNGIVDIDETDPCAPDTDNDGIQDGTESGLTMADVGPDTDLLVFIPDADPTTFTNPLIADTDGDGISDGDEDLNQNGRVDEGESDPNIQEAGNKTKAMPWIPLLLLNE